ncbi:MAG: sulfatase-like hydrolase/transferase [Kiritimatiellae bacterium]|nr:sulfatase-like hydrolase/transferase [Kiritimatiellia bacterium]
MTKVLGSAISILALCGSVLAANDSRPNVVVILTDDQGWADIGYNNPTVYTPHLDELARTGATFANHYVMPQCTPTRVAVMTGRYPGRFGNGPLQASNNPAFPLGTPTLASMFRESGYETFLCGKWHMGSSPAHGPNLFGFDHSYGSLAGAVGMYDHRYRKGEFCETWHRDHRPIGGHENGVHATDLVAREAVRIIEAKREQPFFLYLPFHAPHTPLDERGEFVDQPTQLDPENPNRWLNEDNIRWFNDPDGKIQGEPDPEKRLLLAAVHHLDHAIGEVVTALDRSGKRENTLILFSSDNGPQGSWPGNAYPSDLKLSDFNQPLPMRGKKCDVYEGGIHVPGLANWLGRIAPKRVPDRVHIVDWFPTLATLVGYQPTTAIPWDGIDISATLFSDESLPRRDLYWIWNRRTNRWALRHGDWKLVKYGQGEPKSGEWQLFNLAEDPKEKHDLAARHRELVAGLHQRFLVHRSKDAAASHLSAQKAAPVFMANGVKIGEVSATSAVVWTRLTEHAEGNAAGRPFAKRRNKALKSAPYDDLSAMEGSAPGADGEVRITYWPDERKSQMKSTPWRTVDAKRDFTHQFSIEDLLPGTCYALHAEGRPEGSTAVSCKVTGGFNTAPAADAIAPVRFAVVTGQDYPRRDTPMGHKIYPLMQKQDLDFFVHTGDIEYYDKPAPYADTVELARFKWSRLYALPYLRAFHNETASYFIKDDHDTLKNDCWPGQTYGDITWEDGLAIFREQVPMGTKTYRTIRWGRDLQIWLVEGRDFRSPNTMPDGPQKTIWGAEQKQWFFDTVRQSDVTFRIIISPTPIVGPDRGAKNDNHANRGFTHEGDELRSFIGKQKNMFVICGDRHWQYVSEDPKTGVREFSCGPTSDAHAGGFNEKGRSPMHRYLKVKGGFLSVLIERNNGHAQAVLTHHGVDGTVYNKDVLTAD